MTNSRATLHARVRMAQRGIREKDLELAMQIGTEVEGGFLVREKDCDEVERQYKQIIQRLRRLRGLRIVIAEERIVTAYHASGRKERALLRRGPRMRRRGGRSGRKSWMVGLRRP